MLNHLWGVGGASVGRARERFKWIVHGTRIGLLLCQVHTDLAEDIPAPFLQLVHSLTGKGVPITRIMSGEKCHVGSSILLYV